MAARERFAVIRQFPPPDCEEDEESEACIFTSSQGEYLLLLPIRFPLIMPYI